MRRPATRIGGFFLGALLGGVLAVCVVTLCVVVCVAVKPPRGLDDLDVFFFGSIAALIIGPLVGGVLGVRYLIRSTPIPPGNQPAQPSSRGQ
jgi:hypothetical protein